MLQRILDALLLAGILYILPYAYGIPFGPYKDFVAVFAGVCFILIGQASGLYGSWRISSMKSEVLAIIQVWMIVIVLIIAMAFLSKTSANFSRRIMLTWIVVAPFGLIVLRMIIRGLLHKLRSHGRNTRSVAIVGLNRAALEMVRRLNDAPWAGLRFKGYYDDESAGEEGVELPGKLAGDISELLKQVRNGEIDIVYIALPMHEEARIIQMVTMLSDTTASVYFIPDFFVFDLLHARWVNFNGTPVISIVETPFYGVDGIVKRIEDIVLGTVIMSVIIVPMLAIAIILKLTSPGPVIFKQRRYGLNGEVVSVWKFRSMTVCEDGDTIRQARQSDSRITPFGAFLRKTSLDELPQFINVLQGTMSVVGPRPHAIAHNEEYRRQIHGYMLRHKVKPGITGLAQIYGFRGETDSLEKMQKRVEYDLQYIQEWSLWLDLQIVFRTIVVVLKGINAY